MQGDDAHDIDVVMPMYNLIEYNDNNSKPSWILWQYCGDEPALAADGTTMADFTEANAITDSFKIKGKITGQTGNNGTRNIEIMIPLKYSSKFWKTLEMPLSNCEIKLDLNWFENYVIVVNADQATALSITDKKTLFSSCNFINPK